MPKFRKKPVVVDAFRIGLDPWPDWAWQKVATNEIILRGNYRDLVGIDVHTLEGTMHGPKGHWLIRGVQGECYPCAPDIFEATYEPLPVAPASGSVAHS